MLPPATLPASLSPPGDIDSIRFLFQSGIDRLLTGRASRIAIWGHRSPIRLFALFIPVALSHNNGDPEQREDDESQVFYDSKDTNM